MPQDHSPCSPAALSRTPRWQPARRSACPAPPRNPGCAGFSAEGESAPAAPPLLGSSPPVRRFDELKYFADAAKRPPPPVWHGRLRDVQRFGCHPIAKTHGRRAGDAREWRPMRPLGPPGRRILTGHVMRLRPWAWPDRLGTEGSPFGPGRTLRRHLRRSGRQPGRRSAAVRCCRVGYAVGPFSSRSAWRVRAVPPRTGRGLFSLLCRRGPCPPVIQNGRGPGQSIPCRRARRTPARSRYRRRSAAPSSDMIAAVEPLSPARGELRQLSSLPVDPGGAMDLLSGSHEGRPQARASGSILDVVASPRPCSFATVTTPGKPRRGDDRGPPLASCRALSTMAVMPAFMGAPAATVSEASTDWRCPISTGRPS